MYATASKPAIANAASKPGTVVGAVAGFGFCGSVDTAVGAILLVQLL